jgi:hypothetical protein
VKLKLEQKGVRYWAEKAQHKTPDEALRRAKEAVERARKLVWALPRPQRDDLLKVFLSNPDENPRRSSRKKEPFATEARVRRGHRRRSNLQAA